MINAKKRSVLFALFVLGVVLEGYFHPYVSFDGLCYMRLAGTPYEDCYADARSTIDTASYASIATINPYCADMAANKAHFDEQLPYYAVKPLYVLLARIGGGSMRWLILLSCFSTIGIAYLVKRWTGSALATMLILLSAGVLDLAGTTTPDMLSALLILAGAYCMFKDSPFALFWFALAMLVRLDNGIALALYLFTRNGIWKWLVLAAAAILAQAIERAAGFYGWQTLFYHTFIAHITQPAGFAAHITVGQYLGAFVHGLRMKPPCNIAWAFAAATALGLWMNATTRMTGVVLFAICAAAAHYLMFPEVPPRMFFPYFIIAGIFLIENVRGYCGRIPCGL